MGNPQQFQILHISDLHVSEDNNFNRSVVLDPLIDRVREDRSSGISPEIVVVTGDITSKGLSAEYDLAKSFFDKLIESLEINKNGIFIVPGNHDVNRKKYRKSDVPLYENMVDLNHELENPEFRADLLKGMIDYFNFIESSYPHLETVDERLIPFVQKYQALCGKKIGLVGLNSAWMCRKSPDEREIAIGEYQVKTAVEKLTRLGKVDLVINLFHHPLQWLWPRDRERNRRYFNNRIILCGHLHDAYGGYFSDLDGSLFQFQAGGAYLDSESEWSSRFQYITFDWSKNRVQLDFRKFDSKRGIWSLDSDTGDDGKKNFPMTGIDKKAPVKKKKPANKTKKERALEQLFKKYTKFALIEHRHLTTRGFETNLRVPIELERVYINMHAHIHAYDFEDTLAGRKEYKKRIGEEQLSSLDIKAAFKTAKKRKIKDMVVLGDPGSGKTTLLKYILIMIVEGKAEDKIGINRDIIPFFAPLRKLKDPGAETFTDFISRVCCFERYNITGDAFKKLLDDKKGIVLIDGLDEVADKERRIQTCQWVDSARKEFVHTPFILTSRFSGYTDKSRLEGGVVELSIQNFTPDEVETFLVRWFETVESALHPEDEDMWKKKGHDFALLLVEEINRSEHLKKLAVNPLILQIIALVRRDRGTVLPQRRVELYDECTNVLLEKWDMAKGLDVLLTAREARHILQPLALWLHNEDERRSAPVENILDVIRESLENIGKPNIDPKALLLNIRDRSGIFIGHSEIEYGFTHLSFQEYLAAEQIRNIRKIEILLEKYGERWWKEVILLSLALDNPSIIEEFMGSIIQTKQFAKEISLVTDAIKDSVIKPSGPFIDALDSIQLSPEVKYNAVRVLKKLDGKKVVSALKKAVNHKDKKLALFAFEALEARNATKGIQRPVVEEIPAQIVNTIDDAPMVLVPAGTFLYGSREDDKTAHSDEKPQRVIDLPAFYMDIYPVTNKQYCEFLNNTNPNASSLKKWIDLKGSYAGEKCRVQKSRGKYIFEKGFEKHPVIFVSWHGSDAYAGWAGKRLPFEQEWEKAARGTDGGIYPWGDEFDKQLCNSHESDTKGTSPVDRFSKGKSPYGCFDMAGNVLEWTQDWYDEDKKRKVLRGGSWLLGSNYCRCTYRYYYYPFYRSSLLGFRCART